MLEQPGKHCQTAMEPSSFPSQTEELWFTLGCPHSWHLMKLEMVSCKPSKV